MNLRDTIAAFKQKTLQPVYNLMRRGLARTGAPTIDAVTQQVAVGAAYYVAGRWDDQQFEELLVKEVVRVLRRAGAPRAWLDKVRTALRGMLGFFAGHYGTALSSAIHEALLLHHPIYEMFTITVGHQTIHVATGRVGTPQVTLTGDATLLAQVLTGMPVNEALKQPQKFRTSSPEDVIRFVTALAPVPAVSLDLEETLRALPRRVDAERMHNLHMVLLLNAETGASQDLRYRMELAARKHGVPVEDVAWVFELLKAAPTAPWVTHPLADEPEKEVEDADEDSSDTRAKKQQAHPQAPEPETKDLTKEHINTLWETVRDRLPRAMEKYFNAWTAAWDVDGKFHSTRVFPNRSGRVQFGIDLDRARIVVPLSARNWSNAQLADGLVEIAVLHFVTSTQMLVPAKMDRFLTKYVKEADIARVIDNLNELAQVVIKEDQEAHSLMDLDRQLRERFGDPQAATVAAEWMAKHSNSLLTKLSDRRMIPLFTKWLVEALQDIVANRRVRPDVPQVIVDFIMQVFVLIGSSAWKRDVLHQSLQRIAAIEQQLQMLIDAGVGEARELLAQVQSIKQALPNR
jgi:hypothetical protein